MEHLTKMLTTTVTIVVPLQTLFKIQCNLRSTNVSVYVFKRLNRIQSCINLIFNQKVKQNLILKEEIVTINFIKASTKIGDRTHRILYVT